MSLNCIEDSAIPTMEIYFLIAKEFAGSENIDLVFVMHRKEELVLDYYGCLDADL